MISSATSLFYCYGANALFAYYKKTLDIQERLVSIRIKEMKLNEQQASEVFNQFYTVDIKTIAENALDMEIMTMFTWLLFAYVVLAFHKFVAIKH